MSASSARSLPDAEFPRNGSPQQKLGFALKYVALAIASDWQPWNVLLKDSHLELLANKDPDLGTTDPDGREIIMGCGAALTYLKLVLKHFACLGRVAVFPDLGQPELVARVHFGFCGERNAQDSLLFETMAQCRASGSRPGETPVSETMLMLLSQATAGERGWLEFIQSQTSWERVMVVACAGDSLWRNCASSSVGATEPLPAKNALGWLPPLNAFRGRTVENHSGPVALIGQPAVPAANLAAVKTKTDDKHGWLAAGETMARSMLQAQALGLSLAFFNPVRHRPAREALRVAVGHKGFAQAILSFGALRAVGMVSLPERTASPLTGSSSIPLNQS